MNSIIVGIDLTEFPVYLIKYSLRLAQNFIARVDFVYVVTNKDQINQRGVLSNTEKEEKDLGEFVSQYIGKQHWSIPVFFHASVGEPYIDINTISNDINADIILIGKNRKRLFSFFNDTQNKLLSYTKRPVLIVPVGAQFIPPDRILYMSDFTLDDCAAIFTLVEWSAILKSKLICLHIQTKNESLDRAEKKLNLLKKIFNGKQIEFKMTPQKDLQAAAKNTLISAPDMVCTLHKESNYLQELFGYKVGSKVVDTGSMSQIVFR